MHGHAPTVSWTLATKQGTGVDEIAQAELQNVISAAECACDTSDLYLIGRVTKASPQNITCSDVLTDCLPDLHRWQPLYN